MLLRRHLSVLVLAVAVALAMAAPAGAGHKDGHGQPGACERSPQGGPPKHCDDAYGPAHSGISVSPTTLQRNGTVKVDVVGCPAKATVTYRLGTTVLGTSKAGNDGTAKATLKVPKTHPYGTTTLTATCGASTYGATVTVAADPAPIAAAGGGGTDSAVGTTSLRLAVLGLAGAGVYLAAPLARRRRRA